MGGVVGSMECGPRYASHAHLLSWMTVAERQNNKLDIIQQDRLELNVYQFNHRISRELIDYTMIWLQNATATNIEPLPRWPVLQAQPLVSSIFLKFLSYPYTCHVLTTVSPFLFLFLLTVQPQISTIPHSLYHSTPSLPCILSALTSPNTPCPTHAHNQHTINAFYPT
jgi:hypothetical protein